MKPTARAQTTVAALLVAGALATGCGNEEQNDYVDQVNEIQTQLVSDVTDATTGVTPTNAEQAAGLADDMAAVFNDAADQLEAVDPPDDVADLHQQLVDELRSIGDQVTEAADAFTKGSAQAAAQAALELQRATTESQTKLNGLVDQINSQLQD